jgi:hypothetical protein
MNKPVSPDAGSALRQRFVEDMTVRGFSEKTRRHYIRIVAGFAAFLGRSPDTATAEDTRQFQVHQSEPGMHAPAMNSTVAALSLKPHTAGSFFGDFRTPGGVRNSSRMRAHHFGVSNGGNQTFVPGNCRWREATRQ